MIMPLIRILVVQWLHPHYCVNSSGCSALNSSSDLCTLGVVQSALFSVILFGWVWPVSPEESCWG